MAVAAFLCPEKMLSAKRLRFSLQSSPHQSLTLLAMLRVRRLGALSTLARCVGATTRVRELATRSSSSDVASEVATSSAAESNEAQMVYSRELSMPMLRVSDTTSPRNVGKLTQKELDAVARSDECQQLLTQLETAVLSMSESLLQVKSQRAERLSRSTGESEQTSSSSLQFGWYKPTKSNTLRLRSNNFSPEYASVRAPLFALNALFGGFTSAVINFCTAFDVHADAADLGLSIGFTLGKYQGGRLIVDIPTENKGAFRC